MVDNFTLPARPWPEHSAGIDIMLARTAQNARAIRAPEEREALARQARQRLTEAQRAEIVAIGFTESARAVGERYGVSHKTILDIRHKAGMQPPRRYTKLNDAMKREIIAIGYALTAKQIAVRFRIPQSTVHYIRMRAGLNELEALTKGERGARRKRR